MAYNMRDQLEVGRKGERELDGHFGRWWLIEKASRQEQLRQIDRHWRSRRVPALRRSVEYKTDGIADDTGNAFIEVVSVDASARAGWALISAADLLLYYLWRSKTFFLAPMPVVRTHVPIWLMKHGLAGRKTPNEGYNTRGICVPLSEWRAVCIHTGTIDTQAMFEGFLR